MAKHKTSIGGQALMEGIMMKGPKVTAIAVRKPDGEILLKTEDTKKNPVAKIPVLRGVWGFIESLVTGYNCLMFSADIAMQGQEPDKLEEWLTKHFGKKGSDALLMVAGVLGGMLALVLFMVLPTMITGFVDRFIPLGSFKAVMEGAVKLTIFFLTFRLTFASPTVYFNALLVKFVNILSMHFMSPLIHIGFDSLGIFN